VTEGTSLQQPVF